jgi:serine/threonine protein kinase
MSGELEDRARSRLGTVLRGKYRLESVLGVGGMAVVYKATHRNQAEYAIKMLHPELSYNADLRARFLREGYAANSVKHPGVVRVVDDDVSEDGAAFLVMELLDGVPCDSLLSRHGGRLPLDAVCVLALELLDVLAVAHAKAIIHRDIKPANLFVTRDGSLKVLDFGIARVRDTMAGSAQATGTGVLLGTPAFMAPEQAIGKASDVDARADLWAVGATVFMLATGAMVHEAETAPQLLVKLATQPARSLAAVLPDAPAAIVGVVDRALAFDKAQRWPTASVMRDALASACRAAFGESASRAVLASLVGQLPAQLASTLAAPENWAASPPPAGHSPAQRELPDATMTAGPMPAPLAPGVVVETSRPVSTSPVPPKHRSARGIVAALVMFVALASVVGIALALRGKHAAPEPAVTSVNSTGPAESFGAAVTTSTAVTTSRAIDSARQESSDAAGQNALAPSASGAPPIKSESAGYGHAASPPHPKIPPPEATPTASHLAQGSPVVRPEAPPPPASRQSASPTTSPAGPRMDPLDGRR